MFFPYSRIFSAICGWSVRNCSSIEDSATRIGAISFLRVSGVASVFDEFFRFSLADFGVSSEKETLLFFRSGLFILKLTNRERAFLFGFLLTYLALFTHSFSDPSAIIQFWEVKYIQKGDLFQFHASTELIGPP